MRSVLFWIRANPLSALAGAVALIALGGLIWVVFAGASLNERMAERSTSYRQLQSLLGSSVELPPAEVDGESRTFRGVVNEQSVARRKQLAEQLTEQHDLLFKVATRINRESHPPLRPNLFPEAPESARFRGRQAYLNAFDRMLEEPGQTEQTLNLPRLGAGPPVSEAVMVEAVQRVTPPSRFDQAESDAEASGRRRNQPDALSRSGRRPPSELDTDGGIGSAYPGESAGSGGSGEGNQAPTLDLSEETTSLTAEQREELVSLRREALKRALRRHATAASIYARTDLDKDDEGYPFHVRALPSDDQPSMVQLWERQLELWIQRDIAEAIAETNAEAESVLDAPVKRLLGMRVWPGYVGLHTRGAVGSLGSDEESGRSGGQSDWSAYERPDEARGQTDRAWRGAYPVPNSEATGLGEAGDEAPDNFALTPTGRVSNHVYDIRHASVRLVVDHARLPALFNNLSKANFMTVIDCRIQDVNEYAALREGYIYGIGDMVEVEMVIESAWLRNWTQQLMPTVTKQYLGIEEPPADYEDRR
jgi:hypothetical protein